MCGITGIIKLDNTKVAERDLKAMTDAIAHRGPDDEGFFVSENIGLGHRRLAILDLSSAGHQPMFYDHDNFVIVFNGEIYNYVEIREDLKKEGFEFKTQTDTEVILAAYKKWGNKFLERFNGMWAFAIFDRQKKEIFIARDRLGVKPLYYYIDSEKILFASEIKAILKYPGVKSKPNEKIIWQYLVSGWLDHSEETFFEGIKELRGGSYIIIQNVECRMKNEELKMKNAEFKMQNEEFKMQNAEFRIQNAECRMKNKNVKIEKYWDLEDEVNQDSDEENIKKFKELFLDAVKLRLRSDVPVGTCLSGGLDSSAIVCAMNNFVPTKNIKTFSAIYGSKFTEADENKFIREVVKKTKARSFKTIPQAKDLQKQIKKIIYHQDQPFSTTSIFAQWSVFSLAAKNKMKVILDGQGADELLAGYTGYFGLYFQYLLKQKKIGKLAKEFYYFAKLHPPFAKNLKTIFYRAISAGYLGDKIRERSQKSHPAYSVFRQDFLNKFLPPQQKNFSQDSFQRALYNSLMMNLSPLLRYEDRDSMAFAIESRVPFLDYRLVEFIFSLSSDLKIRNGQTKWIMRQALKNILPEKIRNRQDKIGFATPEEIWLKKDFKKELIKCFSSKSFASRPYFNQKAVLKLYNDFCENKFPDSQIFWRMYCLEMWLRVYEM